MAMPVATEVPDPGAFVFGEDEPKTITLEEAQRLSLEARGIDPDDDEDCVGCEKMVGFCVQTGKAWVEFVALFKQMNRAIKHPVRMYERLARFYEEKTRKKVRKGRGGRDPGPWTAEQMRVHFEHHLGTSVVDGILDCIRLNSAAHRMAMDTVFQEGKGDDGRPQLRINHRNAETATKFGRALQQHSAQYLSEVAGEDDDDDPYAALSVARRRKRKRRPGGGPGRGR